MNTKILISILSLGLITQSYAQKIKTENLEFVKTIQPKLLKTESPIDITLVRTTSSEELKNNNLFNSYVSTPNYINNNTSTPKYIAVLDYIFKPATNKIGKLGTMLNELYFASNTTATLYLMTKEKGVFYQEPIELISNSQDNWKTDALGISTVFKATLSDADASKFLLNGQFRPEVISEIQKKQIERLTIKAYQTIRDDMAENNAKNRLTFNYLKSGDDFTSSDFDKAYATLKGNINPINKSEILNSIDIWKNEANKITDVNEKPKKKYKIAILENILSASYIIDKYDVDIIAEELKNLDEKNDILYFYTKQKKVFASNNQQIKEFNYTVLPSAIQIPEANKNLFNTANSNSKNESNAKIANLNRFALNWDYNPILNLNNTLYDMKLLKEGKKGINEYQNLLMEDVLWYMMNVKNNVKPISSKSKNVLSPFIAYAEKLNVEYETNKLFKFGDERNYKLTKAREYISTKYKLDDFYQFIPAIETAVNIYFENKNPQKTNAFKNAADINSIVQLRKIVNDNFYETQRKEKENQLDSYIESKANIPTFKNEIYYEFKNSVSVLGGINDKKILSNEEYGNYQYLINLLIYKLNTY